MIACLIPDFENFIANEIALGSCGVLQDKLNIVAKSFWYCNSIGSHCRLSSSIRLSFQPDSTPELPGHLFFTDAAVFGDTNLELPSIVSNCLWGNKAFSRVEFGGPDLFMRCNVEEEAHNQSCIFVQTCSGAPELV
ncbi:hypothetical protein Acr_25g0009970 [Actinidia rufa]|uniref:Uncharacterized protein n=1 Tax=Actinidia rufa TaxID=165716 RepID=A0A7J0H0S3_9ERIC|nr:hypothetical protein Acr_25g0009970 [Actinidia rufa]